MNDRSCPVGEGIACVLHLWHIRGMGRVRVSTTVDERLLDQARALRIDAPDSVLLDEALTAFLSGARSAEIDRSYSAYDDQPISSADEWGDLESWREVVGGS